MNIPFNPKSPNAGKGQVLPVFHKTMPQTGGTGSSKVGSYDGKAAPQVKELEEAVLGALLVDKNVIVVLADILSADAFYDERHQTVWEAMRRLFDKGNPIDLLTVTHELLVMGKLEIVGGAFYLTELANRVASAANVEYHSRIVLQAHIRRQLIIFAWGILENAYDNTEDCFEVLERAIESLSIISDVNNSSGSGKPISFFDAYDTMVKEAEARKKSGNRLLGTPTGYHILDLYLDGIQPLLYIIAARPSMGKSAFAVGLAANMLLRGKKVLFFSLEMSTTECVTRVVSQHCEIESTKITSNDLSQAEARRISQMRETCGDLFKNLHLIDNSGLTRKSMELQIQLYKKRYDIDAVFIDHLGLINMDDSDKFGTDNQAIGTITKNLKRISQNLKLPIFLLSQLNREVEKRGGDKKPMLSDLRGSGNVEQDANVVMMLHRPEYYGLTEDDNGESTAGIANVIIVKNRSGKTGTVSLRWQGEYTKFSELNDGLPSNFDFDTVLPEPLPLPTENDPTIPQDLSFGETVKKVQDAQSSAASKPITEEDLPF
jgi:replicative DNA helicase